MPRVQDRPNKSSAIHGSLTSLDEDSVHYFTGFPTSPPVFVDRQDVFAVDDPPDDGMVRAWLMEIRAETLDRLRCGESSTMMLRDTSIPSPSDPDWQASSASGDSVETQSGRTLGTAYINAIRLLAVCEDNASNSDVTVLRASGRMSPKSRTQSSLPPKRWSSFPSHNRIQRNLQATTRDLVQTHDFGYATGAMREDARRHPRSPSLTGHSPQSFADDDSQPDCLLDPNDVFFNETFLGRVGFHLRRCVVYVVATIAHALSRTTAALSQDFELQQTRRGMELAARAVRGGVDGGLDPMLLDPELERAPVAREERRIQRKAAREARRRDLEARLARSGSTLRRKNGTKKVKRRGAVSSHESLGKPLRD